MSKVRNRRPYTKLGLLFALIVGVATTTVLVTVDSNFVEIWPSWFSNHHWWMTGVRVALFGTILVLFYLIRKRSLSVQTAAKIASVSIQLRRRLVQVSLWFACIELLLGQALLAKALEFFFS